MSLLERLREVVAAALEQTITNNDPAKRIKDLTYLQSLHAFVASTAYGPPSA